METRTCILTNTEGENPDDCTTHDHEESMQTQATARPWHLDAEQMNDYGLPRVLGADGSIVAGVMGSGANAALIVRAVNNHDALMAALEDIAKPVAPGYEFRAAVYERRTRARAALDAARE